MEESELLDDKSSGILDLEDKALSYLKNCKINYKNYKKSYMTYLRFIESGIHAIERIGNDYTIESNKKTIEELVRRSNTLKSFMDAIEFKFDRNYNEFIALDKKLISKKILKKMDYIYYDMNDARESFNREINKIIQYSEYINHKDDLDDLN